MLNKYYDKISELLLFGINFRKEDKISITIDHDQRELAKHLVRLVYNKGASYVKLNYIDKFLDAAAIGGSREEIFFPNYLQVIQKEVSQPGWKSIGIYSGIEDDVFEGLPSDRSSAYFKQKSQVGSIMRKAQMSNQLPWCLTFLPSIPMAKKSFPHLSDEEALERYEQAVIRIMHLDEEDPVQYWKDKTAKDAQRMQTMEKIQAEYLHFVGPGTDLKVYPNPKAHWIGGMDKTQDGQLFMANLPTDEIFTTPLWNKTEGRVALTKPFTMHQNLGPQILEAWFEFKDGKVVDYGAKQGKESLDAFFAIDPRSKYIGELALVDPQSPFAKEGFVFYNGLYDENAACHIALGKAYDFTMKEPKTVSDEEFMELGFNPASVHEDMMIGGEEVDVTAYCKDGSTVDIIKNGTFCL
ncbi:aminopeptidase [Spirochaeta cellobiosiphila]|uniref:aminopeptidase n=1 Tax=Spirochaeta cellobiosiphila TaxID=504483 RepID=UPI0003FA7FD8|nr:aminopeptidase [Spirochaeta cellobiosiphila]